MYPFCSILEYQYNGSGMWYVKVNEFICPFAIYLADAAAIGCLLCGKTVTPTSASLDHIIIISIITNSERERKPKDSNFLH